MLSPWLRARRRSSPRTPATGFRPWRRCRATSASPSSPSTKSSSPPTLTAGHVFTDRLLNQRGRDETLLIGAATMRPLVETLIPGVHVVTRPRLSKLTFAGREKNIAAAAALSHRRLLGRGGLRYRRADPPSARRGGGGARRAVARAPATRRSSCTSPATWIISSPPTRSAWASTSTSTTSPSHRIKNSTASASASFIPPNSPRSRAAPDDICVTAPSAPRAGARRSSRN